MTLTEANVANLRAKKLTAKPELSVPRKLLILRPGEGKAKAPPMPDVTDDFYDVHEDDLRAISLGAAAGGQPNAPVMPCAARAVACSAGEHSVFVGSLGCHFGFLRQIPSS